jgi:hypothetical protein
MTDILVQVRDVTDEQVALKTPGISSSDKFIEATAYPLKVTVLGKWNESAKILEAKVADGDQRQSDYFSCETFDQARKKVMMLAYQWANTLNEMEPGTLDFLEHTGMK